jgi:hypothetical protein
MAAPTNAAFVKKVLANSEPSTHGPEHHIVRCNGMTASWDKADIDQRLLTDRDL